MRAVGRLLDAVASQSVSDHRLVVAIAGPPAAGKSTLAAQLVEALTPAAVNLGLDAFHLSNDVLRDRDVLTRKGAPFTFDVAAYRRLLEQLRVATDQTIMVPAFDRSLDDTNWAHSVCEPHHRVVVTEGNYLLLDEQPWSALRDLFDITVWVDAPIGVIEQRIMQRWSDHGLNALEAQHRWTGNDRPNVLLTIEGSRDADLVL